MVDDNLLDRSDYNRLGDLLVSVLPSSTVSLFGAGFAASVFNYLSRSSSEFIVVERINGTIEGAAVVTTDRQSLARRLLLQTNLMLKLPFHLCNRGVWRMLFGKSDNVYISDPELVFIFLSPEHRSKGLGSIMLRRIEARLNEMAFPAYCVRTEEDNDKAINFYNREGFEYNFKFNYAGQTFCLMTKQL